MVSACDGQCLWWSLQVVSAKSRSVGCVVVACDKLYSQQGNQVIAKNAAFVVCFYTPLSVVGLPVRLSVRLSVCLSVRLPPCPSVCPSVRPSVVCLPVRLPPCPSVCLSVCPSVCL